MITDAVTLLMSESGRPVNKEVVLGYILDRDRYAKVADTAEDVEDLAEAVRALAAAVRILCAELTQRKRS